MRFEPWTPNSYPRSTFKKGRSLYIKLGDKDVEYNR